MPGKPAARKTDPTTHGAPLSPGPGSLTTQISNLAAWRVSIDQHACPATSASGSDGVGSVIVGSLTVLIDNQMACRQQDIVVEKPGAAMGPMDPIMMGDMTVLIGDAPGGTSLSVPADQSPAFVASLQQALETLFSTNSGRVWLDQMSANGHTVTFVETTDDNGYCQASGADARTPGVGTDSVVSWNPSHTTTDPGLPDTQGAPGAPVILAHEMVHALHNANGLNLNGPDDSFPGQSGSSSRNEERGTVGTAGPIQVPPGTPADASPPDYSANVPTENSFRDDLGIPRRPSYYPSSWPGGAPW
jgi:uncharacterized Zn-binding protein involved in type VI secretion